MSEHHFYTNIDVNSVVTPFLARAAEEVREGKADAVSVLYPFVDVYAGSQITDVVFDIFCQFSNTDSNVWNDYAYKYGQTVENGISVNYHEKFEGLYAFNKRYGVDPYKVWIERCRERGLHPWISVRMNDCHCPDDEACFLRSDFFYEAREKGYMVGNHYGYYRYCYDYSAEEVRKRMLEYIKEQLERYDTDGIELDFSREIICFDYLNNPDCVSIMNRFMRDVKHIAEDAETRRGHRIRIGVRLMRDYRQCRVYGFDAETWVNENLVDMICVCPRWASCDSNMPVGEWKNAFPGIEISAGLTDLILNSFVNAGCSPATIAAYTVRYLSDSADSMYLFNFFINPYDIESPLTKVFLKINDTCGNIETALQQNLRHIVTYQDIAPETCARWQPFPITLSENAEVISVNTGVLPEGRKYAVIIGFHNGSPDLTDIAVDGNILTDFIPADRSITEPDIPVFADKDTVLYRAEMTKPETAVPVFSFLKKNPDDTVCISYLETEIYR